MSLETELQRELARKLTGLHDEQLAEAEEQTFNFEDASDAIKPIVSSHVMKQLQSGIAATRYIGKWKEWGFKNTNSVLLFSGPPGTGKTTAARWLAKQLSKKILVVNFADIGSEKPGESERNIRGLFAAARRRKVVIFFDEADGIVRSRASLSKDEQWLISLINTLLSEIEKYDGVLIMATNMPDMLEPAVARRISYHVRFDTPDESARAKLWRALWPKGWPLDYSGAEVNKFVKAYAQTGAQIEIAIENAARAALEDDRDPNWKDIDFACQQSLTR